MELQMNSRDDTPFQSFGLWLLLLLLLLLLLSISIFDVNSFISILCTYYLLPEDLILAADAFLNKALQSLFQPASCLFFSS
jgi:hypothetical protein